MARIIVQPTSNEIPCRILNVSNKTITIRSYEQLNSVESSELLKKCTATNKDVFAKSLSDLSCSNSAYHTTDTENHLPIRKRVYPANAKNKKKYQNNVMNFVQCFRDANLKIHPKKCQFEKK